MQQRVMLLGYSLFFLLICSAVSSVPGSRDSLDFSLAFIDTTLESAEAEEEFQDEVNLLFDNLDMEIDTFAWSTQRINSGRFDYRTLNDTVRIPLVDAVQGMKYVHPVEGRITSPFGARSYLWHYGIDLKLDKGDTVRAAFDGVVRVIQFDRRGYGNVVVVRHRNGLETLYGHLSRVTVTPHQKLSAGDPVGLGGNTGRSTGSHLHFEIRYYGEPFDPAYIVDFQNFCLRRDTLALTRANFEYLTEVRKTVVYTVRKGENLGSIARRYRTTVRTICKLNGITPQTVLRVGRRLVVRSGKRQDPEVFVQRAVTPENPHETAEVQFVEQPEE